jgi:hypothetical protein
MGRLAELNVKIGANIANLERGFKQAERTMRKRARTFQNLGDSMTKAVTIPVAGFVGRSVQLFDTQAQAIAQVEAGLKSTGATAGFTSLELQKMASDLQNISVIGDEDILKNVTAQLLTFTNVANEQFPRAQKAILDLSTRLGSDLKGAALQVGKALNDPIAGVSALAESGIQFTESQKTTIRTLVETNRTAEAQTMILKELENQFGGSAEAAAKAGLGPIKQFNNSLGDMMETVGGAILPTLTKLAQKVTTVFDKFNNLSKGTKEFIVKASLLVAAIGPVAWGIGAVISSVSALSGALALLASPVTLVVAALAALAAGLTFAWRRSERFRGVMLGLGKVVKEVIKIIAESMQAFKKGFNAIKDGDFKTAAASFGQALTKVNPINLAFNEGQRLADAYRTGYREGLEPLKEDAKDAVLEANNLLSSIQTTAPNITPVPTGGGGTAPSNDLDLDTEKVTRQIPAIERLGQVWNVASTSISDTKERITELGNELAENATKKISGFSDQVMGFGEMLDRLGDSSGVLGQAFAGAMGTMAQSVDAGASSFKELAKAALSSARKIIGAFIRQGVAGAISKALSSVPPPFNLALATAAGIGAQGIFNKILKTVNIPAFAEGGIVTGPTVALVGEKPGSKGEAIIPLEKLNNFMGGGKNIHITGSFELMGDRLVAMIRQELKNQGRAANRGGFAF